MNSGNGNNGETNSIPDAPSEPSGFKIHFFESRFFESGETI
jgi:hypothetical protein